MLHAIKTYYTHWPIACSNTAYNNSNPLESYIKYHGTKLLGFGYRKNNLHHVDISETIWLITLHMQKLRKMLLAKIYSKHIVKT